MPSFTHGDATIYYEEHGEGFPVLAFAPAGLQSTIAVWGRPSAPINPIEAFAPEFRVIVMDQRNAGGRSQAPITAQDGWHSYAADHIALLDHLNVERCHLYGQCIGGPFIFSLLKAQPERIVSAVIAQPIGRVEPELPASSANFDAWAETVKDRPGVTEEVLRSFYSNLYGPGFAYSVDREFVKRCQTPCLVLAGNDAAHPFAIAEEVARLLSNGEFIADWKEGGALVEAKGRILRFLADHTPVHA